MWEKLREWVKSEAGASALEYGLLVALIAIVIIGAVTALGTNIQNKFDQAANAIGNTSGGSPPTPAPRPIPRPLPIEPITPGPEPIRPITPQPIETQVMPHQVSMTAVMALD